jgi:hypothetical protein
MTNIKHSCSSLKQYVSTVVLLIHTRIHNVSSQWRNSPQWARPSHYRGFTITLRHTTLSRTSLDEWSARRRDLYLTTHNTHIHAPGGIRTVNPSKRAAADPRLRPRGHWISSKIYLKIQLLLHSIYTIKRTNQLTFCTHIHCQNCT